MAKACSYWAAGNVYDKIRKFLIETKNAFFVERCIKSHKVSIFVVNVLTFLIFAFIFLQLKLPDVLARFQEIRPP